MRATASRQYAQINDVVTVDMENRIVFINGEAVPNPVFDGSPVTTVLNHVDQSKEVGIYAVPTPKYLKGISFQVRRRPHC